MEHDDMARRGPVGAKVQREIVLLAAWGPAILLQLAHPLVARAVADHSAFQEDWRRRFFRTVDAMLRLSFGTEDEAREAAARINAIHDRVNGRLPGPAGRLPAGTPYSAHDPRLLAWVHATLVAMNLRVYELYVAPLSAGEKDRYCAEATAIEPYLRIPAGSLPRTASALGDYIDIMLAGGTLEVTDTARRLAGAVMRPPASPVLLPVLALMRLTTVGLLPPAIREAYGFGWSARRQATLERSAAAVRALLACTPPILRHWPRARRRAATSGPAP